MIYQTLRPVLALLFAIAFLLMGNGLQTTLIPIRADLERFDALALGILGSSYYLGFVAGCLGGPYLILRAGHIRAFLALVSVASAAALAHPLVIAAPAWFLFRAITGFCLAGLYLVIESWLNERATNENRGFVLSSYIVVNFAVITAGQMMVTLYPPAEFAPFALASILVSLAAVPVAVSRSGEPAPIALVSFRPRELYRASPVGLVGVFLIGISNGAFWMLAAVYGVRSGFSVAEAASFMSIAVVGGALFQWPIGRLSDRHDRRAVLVGTMFAATVFGLALASVPLPMPAAFLIVFLFGGFSLTGYSLAAAHAYDSADPAHYVGTSAGLLLANGFGSVVGPLFAALVMRGTGPSGLFITTAIAQTLLIVFALYRMGRRVALPTEEKTGFDIAATAPVGAVITPEPLEEADPLVVTPEAADEPVAIGLMETIDTGSGEEGRAAPE
ncbi:MAG TPA: MFS transporter [Kaistiaceae bacterium]|nr:MFS transporter [Kaistiaceae bacterium]